MDRGVIVRDGCWVAAGHLGVGFLRFVQIVLFAHLLAQESYGQYQFIMTILAIVILFSLPSMDTAIMQSVARGCSFSLRQGTRAKLRYALFGSLALVIIAAVLRSHGSVLWPVLVVGAILFPWYSGFTGVAAYYRGREEFRLAAKGVIRIELVQTFAILVSLVFFDSIAMIVAMMMASVGFAWFFWYRKAAGGVTSGQRDSGVVAYGRNLTWAGMLAYLGPYVDRLVVLAWLGFDGLAVYSVAMAFSLQLVAGGKLLSLVLVPKFAKEDETRVVSRGVAAVFCMAVVVVVLVSIGLEWAIPAIFSAQYGSVVPFAQAALLSGVFFLPASVLSAYFQARRERTILYAHQIGVGVAGVALIAVFVPLFGIAGAVASEVVVGMMSLVFLGASFALPGGPRRAEESMRGLVDDVS